MTHVDDRDRSQRLFQALPEAAVVTDLEGIVQEANVAARSLFVRTRLVRRPLVLRVASPDRAPVHMLTTRCGQAGQVGQAGDGDRASQAAIVVTLDGDAVPPRRVELRCSPLDEQRLLWLVRDVTTEEEASARLRSAAALERRTSAQLRRLDEVRNAFVRAVSHDLQAPLTAISGLAGLLVDRPRTRSTDRQAMLRQVQATADLLIDQIRGLLDVERLGRGEVRLQPQSLDAASAVAGVADQVDLGERRLVTDLEVGEVTVDPVVLERIVHNLLANVAEHTPAGTTVWVRLSREPDGLLLAVDDDGPGVAADLRPHVFELFRRPDRVRPGGGVGVGLALVREFAVLHGGHARVEERPGGGASFLVLLREDGGGAADRAIR